MRYDNPRVVAILREIADLMEEQGDSPFRVAAYRRGGAAVESLEEPVARILDQQGISGIDGIPGIGPRLARAIATIVETGTSGVLNRLRASRDPVRVLGSLPGVGPRLAGRIAEQLGVTNLEALETAAHRGDLSRVPGFGRKRIEGIQDALAGRFRRWRPSPTAASPKPSVAALLAVDREYRAKAEQGLLPKIAPRRFNPTHDRWLPILHTSRQGRRFTALFSNTARAHGLGRTRDWVVIYCDDNGAERQYTVLTEGTGPLKGKRVVRGREPGCAAHYHIGHETAASGSLTLAS